MIFINCHENHQILRKSSWQLMTKMVKTLIPYHLRDFPFLNFSFLDIPTRGMQQDLQWIKEKSKMVALGKLPVKRTRSVKARTPSIFPASPATPSEQHAIVQATVAEAPTPTPVTKSTPPPSRPLQFQFTKALKKKLATGAREDYSGRKFHEEC